MINTSVIKEVIIMLKTELDETTMTSDNYSNFSSMPEPPKAQLLRTTIKNLNNILKLRNNENISSNIYREG
jgi:hypothetical protein